ncbi:MAG TPA: serine hydrolase domain-containing protein [Bacillaceae bacterium]
MSNWIELEAYIEDMMKKEEIPGAAVAIAENGSVIYSRGFGLRDLETRDPVTPETIFGIASVTKSFTALAIMKPAEEGKLDLQESVVTYLPDVQLDPGIKIHHLLSHTTGIASMKRREELNGFEEHIRYIAEKEFERLGDPGEYLSYNNDTFLLLGALIEKAAGMTYQDYLADFIIRPLGMERSTFSLETLGKWNNVSVPYVKEDGKVGACPWPKLGNYAAGGGIRSCASDLIKYGNWLIGKAGHAHLDVTDLVAKMAEPVHHVAGSTYYGYALKITKERSGLTLIEHGGGQPGVSSNFGFIPEKGIVAVVLTNISGASAGKLWSAAVHAALGLPLVRETPLAPPFEISPEQLRRFVGTYSSADGSKVEILLSNGVPMAELEEGRFSLRASSDHTLVHDQTGETICFFFKGDQPAWAAMAGLRVLTRDYNK